MAALPERKDETANERGHVLNTLSQLLADRSLHSHRVFVESLQQAACRQGGGRRGRPRVHSSRRWVVGVGGCLSAASAPGYMGRL